MKEITGLENLADFMSKINKFLFMECVQARSAASVQPKRKKGARRGFDKSDTES